MKPEPEPLHEKIATWVDGVLEASLIYPCVYMKNLNAGWDRVT